MFLAKSRPQETIREHTDRLLSNYRLIRQSYGENYLHMNERLWDLLKLAIEYHDVGKAETHFQNKLRKSLKMTLLPQEIDYQIPHNFLSVVMIPYSELGLSEEDIRILVQAVGYHHERESILDQEFISDIEEVICQDIMPQIDSLGKHMNIPLICKPSFRYLDWLKKRFAWGNQEKERNDFLQYVMVKGLLHRIDHASSAYVEVEMGCEHNVGDAVNLYFEKEKYTKRKLQSFAYHNRRKNLIVIAQTGIGKTEAGLLWIDKSKAFFTLPLRVSINAMYERIKDPQKINYPSKEGAVGLLHSSSLDYLEQDEEGVNWDVYYNHSRQLANKLLVTTIDQILKFPFYYLGFEKEYSALAGAKVIIDEMQSYNSKIAALIIRALEMIDAIGGQFMIITATMPKLYLDYILKIADIKQNPIEVGTFVDDSLHRHRIKIFETNLSEHADEIAMSGQEKKVLVICNTVNEATLLYEQIKSKNVQTRLLHALFIQKDRFVLENKIKTFAKGVQNGIWITTQLVEASLDIDFDVLFTEMSTLDSLFQRMGRCYRQRRLENNNPNVFIFTKGVSGVPHVYCKELFAKSIDLIQNFDGRILFESDKMELIEMLYHPENLQGTKFMNDFKKTLHYLQNLKEYDLDKQEAQELMREIHQIQVIPRRIFDEKGALFDQFKNEKDIKLRRKLRREINKYTLGVNYFSAKGLISKTELPKSLRDLAIIDLKYDFDGTSGKGLLFERNIFS